jgi:hypothetical protein
MLCYALNYGLTEHSLNLFLPWYLSLYFLLFIPTFINLPVIGTSHCVNLRNFN